MGPGVPGVRTQVEQRLQHAWASGGLARARAFSAAPAVVCAGVERAGAARGFGVHAAGTRGLRRDRSGTAGRLIRRRLQRLAPPLTHSSVESRTKLAVTV